MGSTAWAIDPNTGYIYAGQYQTVDTGVTDVYVYRSTDDGATWSVFHSFPGPGSGAANKVRHVHAVQWDSVAQRIVVMTGDSDPSAGMYRVNADGTALEPMLLNSQITNITGTTEAARAIGIMPFGNYLAWTGDATSNPYLMRVPRSALTGSGSVTTAERVYRVNSTAWFAARASSDGSRWVFSASQETGSGTALDRNVHLYAVEDQGATVYEIGALATAPNVLTSALAPVGSPYTNSGDVFWLRAHNVGREGYWRCSLARGAAGMIPAPAQPVVYAWQTFATQGSVTVPANGTVRLQSIPVPTYAKKLHVFDAGVWDDADSTGLTTGLRLRVRKKADASTLYEVRYNGHRDVFHMEGAGPVASVTSLAAGDAIEIVLYNTTAGALTGSGFVTLGWGY